MSTQLNRYKTMARTTDDPTVTSPLLILPAEIRLSIYNQLLPADSSLPFNHCTYLATSRLPLSKGTLRPSPLKSHLNTHNVLTTWSRSYGLHLPSTCRQLRNEYIVFLQRRGTRVDACCADCLGRIVKWSVRVGLGIRRVVSGGWWIRVRNGGEIGQGNGWWLRGTGTAEVVNEIRAIMRRWFGEGFLVGGGLDVALGSATAGGDVAVGKDKSEGRWGAVLEYVRVVGRVPLRANKRRRLLNGNWDAEENIDADMGNNGSNDTGDWNHNEDEDNQDDEEEEGDADDNNTDPTTTTTSVPLFTLTAGLHLPRRYFRDTSVVEVDRQTTRYRLDREEQAYTVMRKMSTVWVLKGDGEADVSGWWTKGRERSAGGSWRGRAGREWVFREEIWVGCVFW